MTASPPATVTAQPGMSIRRFFQWPAKLILRLLGWRIVGQPPALQKFVLIGAPHTSNSDGFLMLLVTTALQIRLNFLMKDSWFQGPLGPLARKMGGVAIDRSASHNTVEQIAQAFAERDEIVILIAPEGTRRRTEHWRSGFYHIARQAGVPVVLGFIDYGTRTLGFGPTLELSGDVAADMDHIRAFYTGKTGRIPQNFGPIRLRGEQGADA